MEAKIITVIASIVICAGLSQGAEILECGKLPFDTNTHNLLTISKAKDGIYYSQLPNRQDRPQQLVKVTFDNARNKVTTRVLAKFSITYTPQHGAEAPNGDLYFTGGLQWNPNGDVRDPIPNILKQGTNVVTKTEARYEIAEPFVGTLLEDGVYIGFGNLRFTWPYVSYFNTKTNEVSIDNSIGMAFSEFGSIHSEAENVYIIGKLGGKEPTGFHVFKFNPNENRKGGKYLVQQNVPNANGHVRSVLVGNIIHIIVGVKDSPDVLYQYDISLDKLNKIELSGVPLEAQNDPEAVFIPVYLPSQSRVYLLADSEIGRTDDSRILCYDVSL